MSGETEKRRSGFRPVHVALAVVFGAAVAGFLVGTRPDAPAEAREVEAPPQAPPTTGVAPARSYAEVPAAAVVAGDGEELRGLAAAIRARKAPDNAPARELVARSLTARAERRAYSGAPPVVPHATHPLAATDCLTCHRNGVEVEGRTAPPISHEAYANCTQCHVESSRSGIAAGPSAPLANTFAGHPAPEGGSRAWTGAPPLVPHDTAMRSNCLACHGPAGDEGLRTTHPERQSCLQCHVAPLALR